VTIPEPLPAPLRAAVDQIASDRLSGASEILEQANALLAATLAANGPVRALARAICDAQPSMASLWNAALHAVAATHNPSVFEMFMARTARSDRSVVRFSLECFDGGRAGAPLRLATLSFSRTVATVITAFSESREVRVACAEGRPALEGRRLAAALAAAGIGVTYFTDAALGQALGAVDAVLVGADAVTPQAVMNKCGTRMLAAAALQQGVPVYVVASRDKFVSQAVSLQLAVREGAPDEVWDTPPPGVTVRNPYFEPTPIDLLTSVITDTGIIGAALVPDVCESSADPAVLAELLS
jgi:translation initiation factor 2B subunit (eIF-2B alpha/beta/delta family)